MAVSSTTTITWAVSYIFPKSAIARLLARSSPTSSAEGEHKAIRAGFQVQTRDDGPGGSPPRA